MNIYNATFNKLLALVPTLNEINSAEIKVPGNTALHVKVESRFGSMAMVSLSQFSEHPSGHVVADPSMLVAISAENETADALVFQNFLGTRRVYLDDIAATVDESIKSSMNQFLGHWLANLLAQRCATNAARVNYTD